MTVWWALSIGIVAGAVLGLALFMGAISISNRTREGRHMRKDDESNE